jgi:IclR family transcriptional regulator, mhp operon transcriptional activator
MAAFEPVRAILRGLDILRIVSESGPLVATEIAKRAQLPQPTTVRVLETLISAGYVYREPDSAAYGVTARTLTLSRGFNSAARLVQLAQPLVEGLRSEIGWPSNLSTFEGDSMTIAYTNRSTHGMSIPGRLGAGIPMLATATGLVYLAHMSAEERDAVMRHLDRSKNRWDTDPDIRAKLGQRLAVARRDGYAFADERYLAEIYQSRIWAVAVPIIAGGRVVAGLSSLMLHNAGQRKRLLAQVLPPLRRAASAIARRVLEDGGLIEQIRAPSVNRGRTQRPSRRQ